MKIVIEAAGLDAGQDLRHFTQCCAAFELGTFRNRIDSVTIVLGVAEAASDGKKTTCQVEVALSGSKRLSVQASDADLYVAIYWALEGAGSAVASWLEREHAGGGNVPPEKPRVAEHGESSRAA